LSPHSSPLLSIHESSTPAPPLPLPFSPLTIQLTPLPPLKSTASDTQGEKAAAQPSKYGSGTSSGAGFGNKSTPSDTSNLDHSSTRLDKAKSIDPYSGATEFGSGTTAGAGAGNKGMDHVFSEDERGADGRMELKLDREDTVSVVLDFLVFQ